MSVQLVLTALALLLVAGSAVLLLVVVFRRERQLADLGLAVLLLGLAFGVWWTAIRTPFGVP